MLTLRISTFLTGRFIGEDSFGNRYFTAKKTPKTSKARRWVLYKGTPEPSKVPAEWHGWLHYTLDIPPTQRTIRHYEWEKPHLPNLTGTTGAYLPPGHIARGGERADSIGDYQAWTPN